MTKITKFEFALLLLFCINTSYSAASCSDSLAPSDLLKIRRIDDRIALSLLSKFHEPIAALCTQRAEFEHEFRYFLDTVGVWEASKFGNSVRDHQKQLIDTFKQALTIYDSEFFFRDLAKYAKFALLISKKFKKGNAKKYKYLSDFFSNPKNLLHFNSMNCAVKLLQFRQSNLNQLLIKKIDKYHSSDRTIVNLIKAGAVGHKNSLALCMNRGYFRAAKYILTKNLNWTDVNTPCYYQGSPLEAAIVRTSYCFGTYGLIYSLIKAGAKITNKELDAFGCTYKLAKKMLRAVNYKIENPDRISNIKIRALVISHNRYVDQPISVQSNKSCTTCTLL